MTLFETARMTFRHTLESDAEFLLNLMNTPGYIENIGDRNVRTVEDAKKYIADKYTASYDNNGYGLFMVELKKDGSRIGTCGLVKREPTEDPDVGFAYMPEAWGKGYATEAALATVEYAKNVLKLKRVLGIVLPTNIGSVKTLENAGLKFLKMDISKQDGKEIRVYELIF